MAFHEHHSRSLVKTVTYRVLIIISNSVIFYMITDRLDTAINITLITTLVSTLLYFLHERVWNEVHWGKAHLKQEK